MTISRFSIPPALDRYQWEFSNAGKDDATDITIKIAKTDGTHTVLLTKSSDTSLRLKHGMIYPVITTPDNDQEFLVVCMAYRNGRKVFANPPKFYLTPYYGRANQELQIFGGPASVTALQDSKLSAAGFSCAKL